MTDMTYPDRVMRDITSLRETLPDTRENYSYISGMKRALALYMGSDEARQYLSDNGESE
jgi:hypothetical protein